MDQTRKSKQVGFNKFKQKFWEELKSLGHCENEGKMLAFHTPRLFLLSN